MRLPEAWDGEKNRINPRNHGGIAFETAALAFDDPHAIISARAADKRERRIYFQQAAG